MFTDMFGNDRLKVGLHMHTTRSDGKKTPEEAAAVYAAAGFDAIAITDHWKWTPSGTLGGLRVISGAEYNVGGFDPCVGIGIYHILALGCANEPAVSEDQSPAEIAEAIHAEGGIAVLAHPGWSLNDPSVVAGQTFFDATEIFNTVSGAHSSFRPESEAFCDLLACRGVTFHMLATDDAHYYDGTDATVAFVAVKCAPDGDILSAIKRGDFYASQGPEVHLRREGDRFTVDCSPVSEIIFDTNVSWAKGRAVRGEGLTHAEYTASATPGRLDRFLRVRVTDAEGRRAWTNFEVI